MFCEIKLDKDPNPEYHSGETIKGQVILDLPEPKSMRSLNLIVHGEALGCICPGSKIRISGSEVLIDSKFILFGSPDGPTVELPAGIHNYEFTTLLPRGMAPSYEFKGDGRTCCYIRYWVELKMDIKWDFDNEFKKDFKVINDGNLDFIPDYKLPRSQSETKSFCCSKGSMKMEAFVAKSGFVVGESIPIFLKYENNSNKKIQFISMTLVQELKVSSVENSKATRSRNVKSVEVSTKSTSGVPENSKKDMEFKLKIPKTTQYSNDRDVKAMKLTYKIVIIASRSMFRNYFKFEFPITIGAKPVPTEMMPTAPEMRSPDEPGFLRDLTQEWDVQFSPEEDITLQGYLSTKLERVNRVKKSFGKSWEKVYVVQQNTQLSFYQDQESFEASPDKPFQPGISILGAKVQLLNKSTMMARTFSVSLPNGAEYHFQSDDDKAFRKWFIKLSSRSNAPE